MKLITTRQACQILHRTPATIARYVKKGWLKPQVGGDRHDYYFNEEDVRNFKMPVKGNPLFRSDWNRKSQPWKTKPRQRRGVQLSITQHEMMNRIQEGVQPDVVEGSRPYKTLRVLIRHGLVTSEIVRRGRHRVHTSIQVGFAETA